MWAKIPFYFGAKGQRARYLSGFYTFPIVSLKVAFQIFSLSHISSLLELRSLVNKCLFEEIESNESHFINILLSMSHLSLL